MKNLKMKNFEKMKIPFLIIIRWYVGDDYSNLFFVRVSKKT